MTLPSAPESFEQLVTAAMTSGDYKPVWARFVRTRFFVAMHQPAESAEAALHVQAGKKDGKPLLLISPERDKLASASGIDPALLSGADIIRQLSSGAAIGVLLGKGMFTIPTKLVEAIRSKLPATSQAVPAAPAAAARSALPSASSEPSLPHNTPASPFPTLHPALPMPPAAPATPPPATSSKATPPANSGAATPPANSAAATPPAPPEDWDDDLVDTDLLATNHPAPEPAPAKPRPGPSGPLPAASSWQILGDENTATPAQAPQAPLAAPAAPGGKNPVRPFDVQALKPRNVVHAGIGIDFFVPDAWQQRTSERSLTFFDLVSQAKIEVNSLARSDTSLEKWLELRLPAVTREMPFLKQVGDSYPVSGPEWRGKISAMVTEFRGTPNLEQDETHYLICCYRTENMVATISVRIKATALEANRALFQWLFGQVDLQEPAPAPDKESATANEFAPAPPLFAMNTNGRLGRLRYLAYSIVMYLPFFVLVLLATLLPKTLSVGVGITGMAALIWFPIRVMILRMHDLNLHGKWLWLLLLLPAGLGAVAGASGTNLSPLVSILMLLALLMLSFLPGNKHENDYGEPTVPNPLWIKVLAFVFIGLQVLGITKAVIQAQDSASPWAFGRAAEPRWQTFSPPDQGYSIDMPGIPLEEAPPKRREIVEDIHIYKVTSNHMLFTVQRIRAKDDIDDSVRAVARIVQSINDGDVQESYSPVKMDGLSGVDVRLRRSNGGQRDYRFLIKDRDSFLLMVDSPKEKADQRAIDTFINSFKLNN